MPITWRNVERRGYNDAALLFRGANQSLNTGFAQLQGAVSDQQNLQRANRANDRSNNTDAAKDILASYATPEALEAAKASGEVDERLAALGQNIDRNVVRSGADARLSTLRSQANATQTYEDNQAKVAARPVLEKIAAANLAGEDSKRDALREENKDILIAAGEYGRVAGDAASQDRTELAQGREDYRFGRQVEADQREDDARAFEQDAASIINQFEDNPEAANLTFTEQADAMNAALRDQYPNATPAQRDAFDQAVTKSQARVNGIAEQDQAFINTKLSTAKASVKGNPYFEQQGFDPSQSAVELINSQLSSNEEFADVMGNGDNKGEIINKVGSLLRDGVKIPGTGQSIPVTPSMVESMLQQVHGDWTEWDRSINKIVADTVQKPGFADQFRKYQEFKKTEADLVNFASSKKNEALEAQLTASLR